MSLSLYADFNSKERKGGGGEEPPSSIGERNNCTWFLSLAHISPQLQVISLATVDDSLQLTPSLKEKSLISKDLSQKVVGFLFCTSVYIEKENEEFSVRQPCGSGSGLGSQKLQLLG
mgnify:CR=1 FL=1